MRRVLPSSKGGDILEPHQVMWATQAYLILQKHKLVVFSQQARAGKTHPTVTAIEMSLAKKNILVLAPISAHDGWETALKGLPHSNTYTITNIESLHKLTKPGIDVEITKRYKARATKHNRLITNAESEFVLLKEEKEFEDFQENLEAEHKSRLDYDYDLIVVDEFHKILAGFPYTGDKRDNEGKAMDINSDYYRAVKAFCIDKPLILISGTGTTEGFSRMYNPLELSSYSPWESRDPLQATKKYVVGHDRNNKPVISAESAEVWKHLILKGNIENAGHTQFYRAEVVEVEVDRITKTIRKTLANDGFCTVNGVGLSIMNDDLSAPSLAKERQVYLQLNGGTVITEGGTNGILTGDLSKISKIKQIMLENGWKEDDIVIFYYYKAELTLLKAHFPNMKWDIRDKENVANLRQASAVEGYDLYQYKVCFVYSMSYSGSAFGQMTQRLCNKKRVDPIIYYHLLETNSAEEALYQVVSEEKHTRTTEGFTGNFDIREWERIRAKMNAMYRE